MHHILLYCLLLFKLPLIELIILSCFIIITLINCTCINFIYTFRTDWSFIEFKLKLLLHLLSLDLLLIKLWLILILNYFGLGISWLLENIIILNLLLSWRLLLLHLYMSLLIPLIFVLIWNVHELSRFVVLIYSIRLIKLFLLNLCKII